MSDSVFVFLPIIDHPFLLCFQDALTLILSAYLERLSKLAGSVITCGPVLNWFELDNRGNRLVVTGGGGGAGGGVDGFEVVGGINTPAVAAAYAVKSHAKKASDEISFEVGKSNRYHL